MTLKARIKSLDEVPEALQAFYTEQNSEYVLAVDGLVPKSKLDEFRDNNIAMKKQIDELSAKFADVDPEKYRELSDKAQKERDKKLIDAGKVDELVNERVAVMKADYERQSQLLASEKTTLTTQLEKLVIDNAVRDAASKSGVRPTAVDDVLLRARLTFKLQDGRALPFEGDKPIFGKSGDPMDINEWVGGLVEKAPHLFEQSTGGSAPGSTKTITGNRVARDDQKSFLSNIESIASGKIQVV